MEQVRGIFFFLRFPLHLPRRRDLVLLRLEGLIYHVRKLNANFACSS